MEFSIGEWVERRMDGAVGKVVRVQEWEGNHFYAVDLDPQRPKDENVWSGTTQAWITHHRVHAHLSTSSRDCDGDYSSGRIDRLTLAERCDQYGDLHFKERVLGSIVTLHGHGRLDVTPDGMSWHEQTEEGYRAAEVEWCEDDCTDEQWQRDHRAEEMGY